MKVEDQIYEQRMTPGDVLILEIWQDGKRRFLEIHVKDADCVLYNDGKLEVRAFKDWTPNP